MLPLPIKRAVQTKFGRKGGGMLKTCHFHQFSIAIISTMISITVAEIRLNSTFFRYGLSSVQMA